MIWLLPVKVLVNFKNYQVSLSLDVLDNSILNYLNYRTEMLTIPQETRRHFPSSSFLRKIMQNTSGVWIANEFTLSAV